MAEPGTRVAGAFDTFSDARAAAADLHRSGGFNPAATRITSNPSNPDGISGVSAIGELIAIPGILERLWANLFDLGDACEARRHFRERVRRGGVVVSLRVADGIERTIALNILTMHRGLEVTLAGGGVPIY